MTLRQAQGPPSACAYRGYAARRVRSSDRGFGRKPQSAHRYAGRACTHFENETVAHHLVPSPPPLSHPHGAHVTARSDSFMHPPLCSRRLAGSSHRERSARPGIASCARACNGCPAARFHCVPASRSDLPGLRAIRHSCSAWHEFPEWYRSHACPSGTRQHMLTAGLVLHAGREHVLCRCARLRNQECGFEAVPVARAG